MKVLVDAETKRILGAAILGIEGDGAEALRDRVETVAVSQRVDGKTEIQIAGRLTALLGGPSKRHSGCVRIGGSGGGT